MISIPTIEVFQIMASNLYQIELAPSTREALNALTGYDKIADISTPRALEAARAHLLATIPWLPKTIDKINQQASCDECKHKGEINHEDLCPVGRIITSALAIFGERVDVPMIPRSDYKQSETGDNLEDAAAALAWAIDKKMEAAGIDWQPDEVVDLPDLDFPTWRQN